jgi:hypothetical protein
MSKVRIDGQPLRDAILQEGRGTTARSAADWLRLAAAPVFAIMALLTATQHSSGADMLCSAGHSPSALSGMTLMYALMSVFHAAPWVRLVATR